MAEDLSTHRKNQTENLRELRRGQVVAEARRLVAKSGVEALTFAALETRLGLSRRVATYHFQDKEEIVLAVLESAIEDIEAAMRERFPVEATLAMQLSAVVRGITRGFLDHPEATRILLVFWGRMHADARIRKRNAALFARFRASTAAVIERAARKNALPRGLRSAELAAFTVGTVLGVVGQTTFEKGAVDVDRVLALVESLFVARLSA